jgi:hypothetical protein
MRTTASTTSRARRRCSLPNRHPGPILRAPAPGRGPVPEPITSAVGPLWGETGGDGDRHGDLPSSRRWTSRAATRPRLHARVEPANASLTSPAADREVGGGPLASSRCRSVIVVDAKVSVTSSSCRRHVGRGPQRTREPAAWGAERPMAPRWCALRRPQRCFPAHRARTGFIPLPGRGRRTISQIRPHLGAAPRASEAANDRQKRGGRPTAEDAAGGAPGRRRARSAPRDLRCDAHDASPPTRCTRATAHKGACCLGRRTADAAKMVRAAAPTALRSRPPRTHWVHTPAGQGAPNDLADPPALGSGASSVRSCERPSEARRTPDASGNHLVKPPCTGRSREPEHQQFGRGPRGQRRGTGINTMPKCSCR